MNYLLDSHTALWWWHDDQQLSSAARQVLGDPTTQLYFSAASAYEILFKHQIGKLALPRPLLADVPGAVRAENWIPLGIDLESSLKAASYPLAHRDPFDRILAAQCETHQLTLVSKDPAFQSFPIHIHW